MAKGNSSLRRFGVDPVGIVPWGTHICQLYESEQDLIDILVPFFAEGLHSNEFCLWITSPPLEVGDVKKALQTAVPDLDEYLKKGQIEIVSYNQWNLTKGKFDSAAVYKKWVEKEETTLSNGYDGIRSCGGSSWVKPDLWAHLAEFEKSLNKFIKQHKAIAICSYCLTQCSGSDILNILQNHVGTLIKQDGKWQLIEDAQRRRVINDVLKVSKQKYSSLFQNMTSGFAYHKAVYDQSGKPVDFIFLEVNEAFEKMTGRKREEYIGRRVTQILSGIEKDPVDWIGKYGKVASTGETIKFENYSQNFRKWFSVSAYCPEKGYFIATYDDITEHKNAELNLKETTIAQGQDITQLKQREQTLERLNRTLRAISDSNQAIMRVDTEEEFLKEACRIIVEDCGYRMVWIGLVMDDPAKSVCPVAFSGFEKGYLDTLKITWADTERGQGPTGRAIRSGQPQFCHSMEKDERFKLWREEALKRGYSSSIALPLKSDEKVIAVLTLYSTESTVCSEEEVKLLTELANDFSSGMEILRIRSEREGITAELYKQAALLDLSPDAIIVRKIDGTITFCNKGAEKIYGYIGKETIGHKTHKIFKTIFSQPYESILAQLRKTGRWSGELIQSTKDGRQITVQSFWQAIFDLDGEIAELLESNVDITERKQFEVALERAKVDWERTFDSVPDLITILDNQHRIVRANKAMAQALGKTPEECIGLECYKFVHDQGAPPFFCPHSLAMADGKEHTSEVHEEHLGGDFIVSATPLKDDHGKIIGSVHVARNITLRKQMENKLEVYSKQLEHLVDDRTKQLRDNERLAAIGATAGMVGHDIRNPLQAITGNLYLAKSDLKDIPESEAKEGIKESIAEIEKNVDYINKIVVDLQDFAKPLNPMLGTIDLSSIVIDVIKNRIIPEEIAVEYSVDTVANCFVADSTYIRRMLSNLVNNAVQAMPNGGKLTITAQRETDNIFIHVEDTGLGIPEEVKAKLFMPLFTTKSKGQGFGLAVVKRMSEALGGSVSFDSQTGKGTRFTVRLPYKRK